MSEKVFLDRNGHQIFAGCFLKNIYDESSALVCKTQDQEGKETLGVTASNPDFLKRHPEWPEEYFPLDAIDLSEHEILAYEDYYAMAKTFRKHETHNAELKAQGIPERELKHLTAHILITEDSFTEKYSQEALTYVVSSNNKAYLPNMGGYSVYGSCLDGSDPFIRLEAYLACERGPEDGWKVELCYPVET